MAVRHDHISKIVNVHWPDDDEDSDGGGGGSGGTPRAWNANRWYPLIPNTWINFAVFTTHAAALQFINELIALPLEIGGGGIFMGTQPPDVGLWQAAKVLSETIDEEHPNGYGYNPFTGSHIFYMISPVF